MIINIFIVTLIIENEIYLDSAMAQSSSIDSPFQTVSVDSCPAGYVFSEITDKCEDPCPEGYAISVVTGVCEILPEKLMTEQQESQTTSLQDLTLYENNDLSLRFSYPSNWEVSDFEGTGYKQIDLEIVRSNESKPSYQHLMTISIYPDESGILGILGLDTHPSSVKSNSDIVKRFSNMTTEELAKIMYDSLSKMHSNIEVNETTFGGEKSVSFEYTLEEGYGKPLTKGYLILTIKDNKIYTANYEDTIETYNDIFPSVNRVINSVEIFSSAIDANGIGLEETQSYKLVNSWGSYGIGDGEFDRPTGITIDPSTGNVYVADWGNDRIQKFDSSGNFITKWGSNGTGYGEFQTPADISIDSSGNVYVSDHFNHRIQKFDSNGNFITKWGSEGIGDGEFDRPTGITIDPSTGNVYVADWGNDRIQKFDSNGNFITKWGSEGTGDAEFNVSYDISSDSSGNVYVADGYNHRIQKFDSNGNFITKWGSEGTGDGEFIRPTGITIDPSTGNVYVADTDNHRIQKFDSDGNFITKWGSEGTGDGEFDTPTGVSVDSSDNVYVADSYNNRIQIFSPY